MMQILRDLVTTPRGTHSDDRQLPRSRDPRHHPEPEPRRPLPRQRAERQRLRHEPRPVRAVAARDPQQHRAPAAVARAGDAGDARLRQPDAHRRPDQAAQPGPRVRHLPVLEPASAGRQPDRAGPHRHGHHAAGQRSAARRLQRRDRVPRHLLVGSAAGPANHVCATYTVAGRRRHLEDRHDRDGHDDCRDGDQGRRHGRVRRPRGRLQRRPVPRHLGPSPTQFTYEAPAGELPASGGGTVQLQTGPNQAEGWDDLGPFYTQTYGAFFGVDGSTLEMCSGGPGCNGRLGSKTAQYVGFWSSADFWVAHRAEELADQVIMAVRGVDDAPRPNCCDDPLVRTAASPRPSTTG